MCVYICYERVWKHTVNHSSCCVFFCLFEFSFSPSIEICLPMESKKKSVTWTHSLCSKQLLYSMRWTMVVYMHTHTHTHMPRVKFMKVFWKHSCNRYIMSGSLSYTFAPFRYSTLWMNYRQFWLRKPVKKKNNNNI